MHRAYQGIEDPNKTHYTAPIDDEQQLEAEALIAIAHRERDRQLAARGLEKSKADLKREQRRSRHEQRQQRLHKSKLQRKEMNMSVDFCCC